MQKYETLFICKPDLPETDVQAVIDRLLARIDRTQGKAIELDEWGPRKLAYSVRYRGETFTRGYYILLTYAGSGETVEEIERNIKLMDQAFRYQTFKLDGDVDIESIAEMAHNKPAHVAPEPEEPEPADEAAPDEPAEDDQPEAAPEEDSDQEHVEDLVDEVAEEPAADVADDSPSEDVPSEDADEPAESSEPENQDKEEE